MLGSRELIVVSRKCHDAIEPKIKLVRVLQQCINLCYVAGEAMNDTSHLRIVGENSDEVIPGITNMKNEWKIVLQGNLDLRSQDMLLLITR